MQNLRGQTKSIMVFSEVAYRPLAANNHVVQNPPCWRASSLLFPHWEVKLRWFRSPCFNVPVREY